MKKQAAEECSIPSFSQWQSRAQRLLGLQAAEKMRDETGRGLDQPPVFYLMFTFLRLKSVRRPSQVTRQRIITDLEVDLQFSVQCRHCFVELDL